VAGAWGLQQQAQLPHAGWILLLPVLGAVLALLPHSGRRIRWRRAAWTLWWAASGFLVAAAWAHYRLADALPAQWEGRDVRVRGVIAEMPQADEDGTQRFVFDVEAIATPSARVPARISLGWYAAPGGARVPLLQPGQRWQFTVRLRRPHASANPHAPDLERWYLERGIRALGYVRPGRALLLDSAVARPGYALERLRSAARARIRDTLPGVPAGAVLAALSIGDQQAITRAQWEVFTATGVNHLMSISGLHITMLAAIAFALTRRAWARLPTLALRVPAQRAAALAGLAVGTGYALLAGFAVPAQRTVLMMAVVALALWSGRPVRGREVLAAAAIVVVACDPWAVVSPGFWLSFAAVALILFVTGGRLAAGNWLVQWGRVQWAVTLGLAPLLLALFQQLSLISPLANALAVPLVSLAVVPLCLAGLLVPGDLLLGAAAQTMHWTWELLAMLAQVPLATWSRAAPPPWSLACAAAGVAWLLGPAGLPARWLGALGCVPLALLLPPRPAPGEAWLDVLDVGQGQAILVRTRHHALLYDTGPAYRGDRDAGARIVVPHLRAVGVRRLDALVISHDDNDHSGGAASVRAAVPVARVLASAAGAGERCTRGQHWTWDGVEFALLHPDAADYNSMRRDNDLSCVLRVRGARYAALLSGDIEAAAEDALVHREPRSLRADVLLAPHHGSATSSSPRFLSQVQPRIAIFTVGYRNRFGHPAPVVEKRYAREGVRGLRSDRDGAVEIRLGATLQASAWRALHPRYWQVR